MTLIARKAAGQSVLDGLTAEAPVAVVSPEIFGCVRRPELDTDLVDAWEWPSGDTFTTPKQAYPLLRVSKDSVRIFVSTQSMPS